MRSAFYSTMSWTCICTVYIVSNAFLAVNKIVMMLDEVQEWIAYNTVSAISSSGRSEKADSLNYLREDLCRETIANCDSQARVRIGGESFVGAAAGEHHTLAVTKYGDVYSCGRDKEGQLGHGEASSLFESTPRKVSSWALFSRLYPELCLRLKITLLSTCDALRSYSRYAFCELGMRCCRQVILRLMRRSFGIQLCRVDVSCSLQYREVLCRAMSTSTVMTIIYCC